MRFIWGVFWAYPASFQGQVGGFVWQFTILLGLYWATSGLCSALQHIGSVGGVYVGLILAPPMAGFPIGGGHNPSLPSHKCSRTTAERGQVRRDSFARCTTNKRTHLPGIGGVETVPFGGPGDGRRWEMERGGSTVPPTVGTNQSTVNPPAPATSNCHSSHFPVVGHFDPCWHASPRIVAALHPNRWRHQW